MIQIIISYLFNYYSYYTQGWLIAYLALILIFGSGVTNLLIKSFKSSENEPGNLINPS